MKILDRTRCTDRIRSTTAAILFVAAITSICNAQEQLVTIKKLAAPIYPSIARMARVQGDVIIRLSIAKDGTVQTAAILSGPPLLTPAALESAKASIYECLTCTARMSHTITYHFDLQEGKDQKKEPHGKGKDDPCRAIQPTWFTLDSSTHVSVHADGRTCVMS